jgi:hypothetical protein
VKEVRKKNRSENNLRNVPKNLPIATTDAEIFAHLTECIYYTGENVVYSLEIFRRKC